MLIKSVFANSAIPSHHTQISGLNFVEIIVNIILKVLSHKTAYVTFGIICRLEEIFFSYGSTLLN